MDEEIFFLKEKMHHPKINKIANTEYIQGKINNTSVTLVKSGIGKVNAAMNTAILIDRYQPDCIINTGTAGGFSDQLEVGDLVISDAVVHHDVDVTGFDYEWGQVPGCPTYFKPNDKLVNVTEDVLNSLGINYKLGLIATGDVFMNNPQKINAVKEKFPGLIALEMEAAAICQVAHQFKTPFIVIRALSDIAGETSSVSFEQFVEKASAHASKIIVNVINKISQESY